jgi:hypothetical protein
MGLYLFERCTSEGAGRDAGQSLQQDVSRALDEIDWVDSFAFREGDDAAVVGADVVFDEQWPDIRTSNPDQVSEVFHRLGLRTIGNPALSASQVSADDPLSIQAQEDDSLDLFDFDEDDVPLSFAQG